MSILYDCFWFKAVALFFLNVEYGAKPIVQNQFPETETSQGGE